VLSTGLNEDELMRICMARGIIRLKPKGSSTKTKCSQIATTLSGESLGSQANQCLKPGETSPSWTSTIGIYHPNPKGRAGGPTMLTKRNSMLGGAD
jgi:hypothetical protein